MGSQKTDKAIFDRRTLTVWGCLVVSLSVVSGLLLGLHPLPHAPAVGPVLTVFNPTQMRVEDLVASQATADPGRWKAVVIHHSMQAHGNAETIGQQHQAAGRGGLGYHFVIGNGDGAEDGEIQTGYRWAKQIDGLPLSTDPSGAWFRKHAISICLVGNGDRSAPTAYQVSQLVSLVRALQQQFKIPADKVYLHRDLAQTTSPGLLFPASAFREQLLDVSTVVSRR